MREVVVGFGLALMAIEPFAPVAHADERVVVRVMFGAGSAELDAAAVKVVGEAAGRARACEPTLASKNGG